MSIRPEAKNHSSESKTALLIFACSLSDKSMNYPQHISVPVQKPNKLIKVSKNAPKTPKTLIVKEITINKFQLNPKPTKC
jgi:hypothetical protein